MTSGVLHLDRVAEVRPCPHPHHNSQGHPARRRLAAWAEGSMAEGYPQ